MTTQDMVWPSGGGYLRVVAAYLARRGRRQESPGDETLHDAERTQQHGGVGWILYRDTIRYITDTRILLSSTS